MSAHHGRSTQFEPVRTTADEPGADGELFGVHIPELQLSSEEYRRGLGAAGLTPDEHYLELGSGHGIGLVIAAKEFGAHALGVEYLEDAIERANLAAERSGVADRVRIVRTDLRRVDPTSADVVHMHLGPAFHDVLAARLEQLLEPRARVVAAGWRVWGWQPVPGTEELWDGGYVYRPGDPRLHLSWSDELVRDGRVVIADAHVHADVEALELRVDTDGPIPPALLSDTVAHRGQTISVGVGLTGHPIEVSVWGRSRSGRFTQRGPTLDVPPR